MVDWQNTWPQIESARPNLAILPVGSTEQHGPHLPVGTDFIRAQEIARKVAAELDAYLLPGLPYGNSEEHRGFPGTVWLRPATLAQVIKDIVASLSHSGIRRLVILNAHGGNWVLKPTVRELNREQSAVRVIWAAPGALSSGSGSMPDLHAGAGETSEMLALRPELVGDERPDCQPPYTREFLDYVPARRLTPTGVWGKASEASAESGRPQIEQTVRAIVAYVRDTFAALEKLESEGE